MSAALALPIWRIHLVKHLLAGRDRKGLLASLVIAIDGQTSEVGSVGREGIVGATSLLGPAPIPANCMIQLEATALRIAMPDLKETFHTS